jgi:hypothetical protein
MSLADQHTGVMDGLGKSQFEHLGLQAALQEVLNLQAQHVIELHAALVQHTNTHEATEKCIA